MAAIITLPSHKALLTITGINPATYRSDLFRDQAAAAFGAAEPVLKERPLAVDAVAMQLRNELAERGLSRKLSAIIVRGYFDHWIEAVVHADHDGQDVVFVVVEVDPKVHADSWFCAIGPVEKLYDYLATLPGPHRRVLLVHVRDVLADIRGRAAKAKLDLSGHFFVPPDHPLLAQIKTDWAKWRAENKVSRGKHPKLDRQYRRAIDEFAR